MNAANATSAHPRPINLAFGEPAENPAPEVVEAAVRAVRDGLVRYGPAAGLTELRELIAYDQRIATGLNRRTEASLLVIASGTNINNARYPVHIENSAASCNSRPEPIFRSRYTAVCKTA